MNKVKMLKIVNPILGLAFLGSAGGGLTRAIAPDAIPYDKFHLIHPVFGYLLAASVVAHIYLNWGWIKTNFFKKKALK